MINGIGRAEDRPTKRPICDRYDAASVFVKRCNELLPRGYICPRDEHLYTIKPYREFAQDFTFD